MQKILFICMSFFSILLVSCEKEIDVEIIDNDPKIVVSTHIGVGEMLKIYVSSSIPLYDTHNEQINFIEDALSEISSDNINWKTLDYNFPDKYYSLPLSTFSASEGQTYYIRISANGYKSVKSYCSIPVYSPISVAIAKLDSTTDISGMGYNSLGITIKVKDATGQKNYYGIYAYLNDQQMYIENNSLWVFSDNLGDGKEFLFNYTSYYWQHGDNIKVRLYQTSESFYRFHFSYANYVSDNPFSEPSPVYSNIENGLGICSGYTYRDYSFIVP